MTWVHWTMFAVLVFAALGFGYLSGVAVKLEGRDRSDEDLIFEGMARFNAAVAILLVEYGYDRDLFFEQLTRVTRDKKHQLRIAALVIDEVARRKQAE